MINNQVKTSHMTTGRKKTYSSGIFKRVLIGVLSLTVLACSDDKQNEVTSQFDGRWRLVGHSAQTPETSSNALGGFFTEDFTIIETESVDASGAETALAVTEVSSEEHQLHFMPVLTVSGSAVSENIYYGNYGGEVQFQKLARTLETALNQDPANQTPLIATKTRLSYFFIDHAQSFSVKQNGESCLSTSMNRHREQLSVRFKGDIEFSGSGGYVRLADLGCWSPLFSTETHKRLHGYTHLDSDVVDIRNYSPFFMPPEEQEPVTVDRKMKYDLDVVGDRLYVKDSNTGFTRVYKRTTAAEIARLQRHRQLLNGMAEFFLKWSDDLVDDQGTPDDHKDDIYGYQITRGLDGKSCDTGFVPGTPTELLLFCRNLLDESKNAETCALDLRQFTFANLCDEKNFGRYRALLKADEDKYQDELAEVDEYIEKQF